jgi:hypothetical protein
MRQSAASEIYRLMESKEIKDRAKANLRAIKPKNLVAYPVPDDPFKTVFWCSTPEKGARSVEEYIKRKSWVK